MITHQNIRGREKNPIYYFENGVTPESVLHNLFQWVFGAPFSGNKTYEEEEEIFSAEIMDVWINFAKYG